jgi:VanZ family protein
MLKFAYNILAKLASIKFVFSTIWTLVILYLSLARIKTPDEISHLFPHEDKVVHFLMYFILSTLLLFELRNSTKKNIITVIMFYTISFGILMEILQGSIFTYRSPDFFDICFNSLGSVLAMFNYFYYNKFIKK